MDQVIFRGYGWDAVPFRSQSLVTLTNADEIQSATDLRWVHSLSHFAKAGYLQLTIVIASFFVITRYLLHRPYSKISKPEGNIYGISFPFELPSQIFRAAALAFTIVAATQNAGRWADVTTLAYAFILGILRLINDLEWRHVALHHVNAILASSLLILAVEELLPYVDTEFSENLSPMVICSVSTLTAAVLLALVTPRAWIPPSLRFDFHEDVPIDGPAPEETCSWLEYFVTYEWLTPLMLRGLRQQVTLDRLPTLPWYDDPKLLLSRIRKARLKGKSTLWTLVYFVPKEIAAMSAWVACAFLFELIAPFAMYKLLGFLTNPEKSLFRPWVWLILLFVGPLSRSVCYQQYIFTSTRLVVRVRTALTQEMYHKAMDSMELDDDVFAEIAATDKGETIKQSANSTGRLANLMSADIESIVRARDIVLVICGVSVGSIVSLWGLYKLLDWSALVGIAAMMLLSPFPLLIGRSMVSIQHDMKRIQDSRISAISEYLASIRAIKYFSWEDAIINRVNEIRLGEQKKIWSLNMLYIALNQLTEAIPNLSLVLIFALQVLARKEPLTADVAFTAITLVRTLRRNLSQASQMSRGITAASVSVKRLDRFFYNTTPLRSHPVGPPRISNATFRRNKNASFALKDISIDFVEGGLNVVTGPSGSGKSTLLMSILGETILESGEISCPNDIAYASQSPWLQNETIRENILFNSPFEQVRYDRVINACGLPIDFNEFPERDGTEVGENGASLSGGQKSRVALARALYSKASMILLDDVFSALDSKTSALLWEEAFCGDLLKGRTVVLVTQMPWVPPQADLSVTLENGSVKDIQQNLGVVRKSVTLNAKTLDDDDDDVDTTVETPVSKGIETNGAANGKKTNGNIKSTQDRNRDEVAQEAMKTGQTARLQFFQYMRLFGNPFYAILAIIMSTLSTATFVGTGLWIAVWVDAYGKDDAYDIAFYLGIYALWSLADAVFNGLTYIAYENGGWYAARSLHSTFIKTMLSVPLSWYRATPVGRVVNRFSRDMDSIDSTLAGMLRLCVEMVTRLGFQIAAVGSVLPVFMLPAAACCAVGIAAGEMYTRTSVAIKRLVSSSQSPVFAQFADSLAGLAVIRAHANMPQIFGNQLADKLRVFEKATEAQYNCNRWVALKVDMATTLVTVAAGAIAVSQAGLVAAGLVGFSLTNATTLSQLIILLVRASNELEIELQSYHRVREYATIEPEEKPDEYKNASEYSDDPESALPKNWPRSGQIEFRNVTIKYDVDGPEILKDINLKFAAGERVAVVGRTGSGKSTLVLSLLRFTNIVSGQILFDGVDITKFPRRKLREALTIIPQEAVLFNGDVRSNLDPTGKIPSETLEKALQYCSGIASFQYHQNGERAQNGNGHSNGVSGTYSDEEPSDMGITLSTPVKPKGENFSHGQRQVLSLCRALVRKSKLMLLDEATASMDYETDQGIQEVLRKELSEHGRDRTLVTIAHRLKTIIDYDRVVVMSAGSAVEVGSPKELYEARGQFYDMMKHSGEFEDLERFLTTKQ
ncbi:P-loop containing nucleoside triphosphate hydrolase protein [Daldinia sp. FL1419]|nr:P-loop containing nucleoside triphosphate hydrolase protein [Daldinia sp. FL1419]